MKKVVLILTLVFAFSLMSFTSNINLDENSKNETALKEYIVLEDGTCQMRVCYHYPTYTWCSAWVDIECPPHMR
jgi:hypothetical protein